MGVMSGDFPRPIKPRFSRIEAGKIEVGGGLISKALSLGSCSMVIGVRRRRELRRLSISFVTSEDSKSEVCAR